MGGYEVDVTKNIMKIEMFKNELLSGVSNIFKVMTEGGDGDLNEVVADDLSNIILICYMLGKRMGIPYKEIDKRLARTIKNPASLKSGDRLFAEDLPEFMEYLGRKA